MKIIHYLFLIVILSFIKTEVTVEDALDTFISNVSKMTNLIKDNMPQFYNSNLALFKDIESKIQLYKSLIELIGKQTLINQIKSQLKKLIPEEDIKDLQKFIEEIIPLISTPTIKLPTIEDNKPLNQTKPIPNTDNDLGNKEEEEEVISQDTFNQSNFTLIMIISIVLEIILLLLLGIYIVTKRRIKKKQIDFIHKDFQSLTHDFHNSNNLSTNSNESGPQTDNSLSIVNK